MAGKKVLVVDNDIEFLDEIEMMLTLTGYSVFKADSGRSALRMAREVKPSLIVLDVRMPVETGFETAKALRNIPETSKIPVVVMTGFPLGEADRFMMRDCGILRCVEKPIKPLDIISEIEWAFRKNIPENK